MATRELDSFNSVDERHHPGLRVLLDVAVKCARAGIEGDEADVDLVAGREQDAVSEVAFVDGSPLRLMALKNWPWRMGRAHRRCAVRPGVVISRFR